MVEGSGTGNGEVIAFVAVPFCKHPIQRKRLDCQDICLNRRFWPGGVNFAAGYVLDVIFVLDIIVGGGLVRGWPVVDYHVFRDHHPA